MPVVVDPPIDCEDTQTGKLSQKPGVLIDLHRELPGRGDDDGPGKSWCGHPVTSKETSEAGNEKGRRLPGPSLGLPGYIFPLEDQGQGQLLNLGAMGESGRLDTSQHRLGKVEGLKCDRLAHHLFLFRSHPGFF